MADLVAAEVREAAGIARRVPDPRPDFEAKRPIAADLTHREQEYRGDRNDPRLTLLEAVARSCATGWPMILASRSTGRTSKIRKGTCSG